MLRITANVRLPADDEGHVYHDQDVFEVSEVTLRILEICQEPQSKESVVAVLLREYDVDQADLAADVTVLVTELLELDLLEEAQ